MLPKITMRWSWPGVEPRPLFSESSTLTIRPVCLRTLRVVVCTSTDLFVSLFSHINLVNGLAYNESLVAQLVRAPNIYT